MNIALSSSGQGYEALDLGTQVRRTLSSYIGSKSVHGKGHGNPGRAIIKLNYGQRYCGCIEIGAMLL